MKANLEQHLDDSFDFTHFDRLSATGTTISEATGKILYIPTDIPVPFDKRVLSALVDDQTVRVLPMPTDRWEFKDTVYTGIEHLVDNSDSSVVFFCPRFLVDVYEEVPGSDFIHFERVQLQDTTRTIRTTFERATGTEPRTDAIDDLSEFFLRVFTAAVTGAELNPAHIQTSTDDQLDDFYIPYDNLTAVPQLVRDFFLTNLGIPNIDLFDQLDPSAQQNIYISHLLEKYGDAFATQEPKYETASVFYQLNPELQELFRRLVFKRLVQGRLFDSTLEELAPIDLNRELIDTIQHSYQHLADDDSTLNIQEPAPAADTLTTHFGILFATVDDDEFNELVTTARDQLSSDSQQIEAYRPERAIDVVEKVDTTLRLLAQVALINHPRFVNAAFPEDRWQPIFQRFIHNAYEHDRTDLLDYRYLRTLNQARKEELREREAEEEAEAVRDLPVELATMPEFLEEWTSFIAATTDDESVSPLLRQELIDKYDNFCSEIVDRYDEIVASDDWVHLTDLLTPHNEDQIRITVIIDSFGYTDYLLLNEFDFLSREPDNTELVFSNLPSYTPSAMSTIMTGLPATETGIVNWEPRHGNTTYDLQHSHHDEDTFDFIETQTNHRFHLIQRPQLNDSGITRVARNIADIRLSSRTSFEGDDLDAIREGFTDELADKLEERQRIMEHGDPEQATDTLESLSNLVIYIEDFDQILHDTLAFAEFENYYNTLGNFIDGLVTDIESAAEQTSDPVHITVTADHGKLTRYEMETILDERPEFEFTEQMLTDAISLEQAYRVNFRNAEFTNRSDTHYLTVAADDTEPPVDLVRKILADDEAESVTDDQLTAVIEEVDYLLSGSKFLFGWSDDDLDAAATQFHQFDGIDVYQPRGESVFDLPDIGLISRYDIKNTSGHDHGYHGGTSISEMAAIRLNYHSGGS